MNFFEQLEQGHYGSIELKKQIGPNLVRGLAVSVAIFFLTIAVPLIFMKSTDSKPELQPPVRVVDISLLTKIVSQQETPKQVRIAPPGFSRSRGSSGGSASLARFLPGEVTATPYELPASSSLIEESRLGLAEPLMKSPLPNYETSLSEPGNIPLPDLSSSRSTSGDVFLPSGLPSPQTRGEVEYMSGGGTGGLPTALPSIGTGAGSGTGTGSGSGPLGDLPGIGSGTGGFGDVTSTAMVPGAGGSGDRYVASAQPGTEESGKHKSKITEDIMSERELSGLLKWLRSQKASFPPVVKTYLETHDNDQCSIISYDGWDIFIQFSEDEHQLKIFLTKGTTGILLADSDFKSRSQLLGMGRVDRSTSGISSIESAREKPTFERTNEFYRVFQNWMQTQGITMGSRAAK